MEKGKGIFFICSNPIAPNPRVEKQARTLSKNGFKITVIGWDREGKFPQNETKDYGEIYRIQTSGKYGSGMRNLFAVVRWNIVLFSFLSRNRANYDFVHACDFDSIIPGLLCKFLYKKKVIYDICDFYAEMIRNIPDFVKAIIKHMDLFLIGLADAVILADEIRTEQIKGSKPKKLVVIYNSPPSIQLKEGICSGTDNHNLVIAYIGLLQRERAIFGVIDVVKEHPECKLVLGGYGAEEEGIKEYIKGFGNIEFVGRVPYEKTLEIYASCDVMFAIYDPRIPNHRYSSANKLFEAMMLGKPIIVARNTGMDLIVEKYKLGFVVEYGNKKELEEALTKISEWDESALQKFSENAKKVYAENFSWGIMERRLVELYRSLAE
jgi:glycosyltransferase involved in cell wall biosynthesis